MRILGVPALLMVIAACGGDGSPATTTTPPPASTTTTLSGAVVDDFDGATAMTFPYFSENAQLEWLEGGVLRLTRIGAPDTGIGIVGLYPGTHGDAAFTLRFRPIPPDSTANTYGIVLLADDPLLHFVEANVGPLGNITVIPLLEGYPSDYWYADAGSALHPGDWNELQVVLTGGRLEVSLNGFLAVTMVNLPLDTGRFGVSFGSSSPGASVEIDEFRMEPVG